MKRMSTESQIVVAIKKQESGIAVKDICRELSISDATFYNWKAKYGGMEASNMEDTRVGKREYGAKENVCKNEH